MFLDVIHYESHVLIRATRTTNSEDESNLQPNQIELIFEG